MGQQHPAAVRRLQCQRYAVVDRCRQHNLQQCPHTTQQRYCARQQALVGICTIQSLCQAWRYKNRRRISQRCIEHDGFPERGQKCGSAGYQQLKLHPSRHCAGSSSRTTLECSWMAHQQRPRPQQGLCTECCQRGHTGEYSGAVDDELCNFWPVNGLSQSSAHV